MNRHPLNLLLHEGLERNTLKTPNKTVAVIEGISHSYSDLDSESTNLAAWMAANGIARGDRVTIFMDNTWFCVVSIFAALKLGGVFVMINPQTKPEKLRYILDDCSAKALLTDGHLHQVVETALQSKSQFLKLIAYSGQDLLKIESDDAIVVARLQDIPVPRLREVNSFKATILPNDLVSLIYTSGSTGNPKGVMHTHLSMVYAMQSIIQYLRLDESHRILNVLPLAFDYGLYQLLMTVWLGATIVLERSFTYPAQILNRIAEQSPTVFPGVPTIFSILMGQYERNEFTLESFSRVTNTAASLPKEWLPKIKKIFPNALIFKMYGLTECKRTCYLEPELIDTHGGSVGKAIPGTETYLCSLDGKRLEGAAEGVLYVRGPHVMQGYWNQPGKTAEMLVPTAIPGQFDLCTHDWFRRDEEGFLYFQARTDDIVKTRGEKVSPIEVENALLSIAGVQEAAVIGVPDAMLGAAIKAFVSLKEGVILNEALLKRACLSKLENFMVPKFISILESLPKSPNGKIDKLLLSNLNEDDELPKLSGTNQSY